MPAEQSSKIRGWVCSPPRTLSGLDAGDAVTPEIPNTWNLRHDHMRASDKGGPASGFRRVDERKDAMRGGRMHGTDVDSAASGISTGESGAANLHLLYVKPSTQQGAAYRSASRELQICTSTDAIINGQRPLGHANPSDSSTHASASVPRTQPPARHA